MKNQLQKHQVVGSVLKLFLLSFVVISVLNALRSYLHRTIPNAPTISTKINNDPTKLSNANFEKNDFGSISDWSDTSVDIQRWYLTQVVTEDSSTRWAEPVDLAINPGDRIGHGIHSLDQANCESNCDTSVLQIVAAQPNVTYKLSTEAKRTEGQGGTLYLDFLDKDKHRIKVKTVGGFTQNTWSQSEVFDTAPEGTEFIRVILYSSNSVESEIFWDNVSLEMI